MKTARLVGRYRSRAPNPGRAAAAARLVTYARSAASSRGSLHSDPVVAQSVRMWLLRFARQLERVSS